MIISGKGYLHASETDSLTGVGIDKTLDYRLKEQPRHIDNYLYSIFAAADANVYNLRGFPIGKIKKTPLSLKVNPAGHSYALLTGDDRNTQLEISPIGTSKVPRRKIPATHPTAIAYTADSRLLVVADGHSLLLFDSRTAEPRGQIALSIADTPKAVAVSPDGRFWAIAGGENIEIINAEDMKPLTVVKAGSAVTHLVFDSASSTLGATVAEPMLLTWTTAGFEQTGRFSLPAPASTVDFHPQGKYAALAMQGDKVYILNLIEPKENYTIADPSGGLDRARFITDGKGTLFLAHTTPSSVRYKRITGFTPHFTRMLEDELNRRMLEWTRMRPMETDEQYAERVNPESTARQRKLFANEIATSLAGDLVSHSDVTLGGYNPSTGMLAVGMGNLPSVYLTVPEEDVEAFGSGSDIEFRNPVYGLAADDTFVLIYAEVYNRNNGKTYVFDNLDNQNLDYLATDDSFMSLELVRQSQREDARLQAMRDEVVKAAMSDSVISEHTTIDVNAGIVPSTGADGRRTNDYRIDFTYTVDPDFSAKEDFAPGKYLVEESPAATAMLSIVRKAFEGEFARYVAPGKRVKILLTGTADALPITRPLRYDGSMGEWADEPCRIDGNLSAISVDKAGGIATNEQLAFMRAQAVRAQLQKSIAPLAEMQTVYDFSIRLSKEKGGAHRRINISFVFPDAL